MTDQAIWTKNAPCFKAMLYWLERVSTSTLQPFPAEKLAKIVAWELVHIIRCAEQAAQFSDADLADIETETGKPYLWRWARGSTCPWGWVFMNPQGGNATLTADATDKAVYRCADLVVKHWKS